MKTKVCTKCGVDKALSEFYKRKKNKLMAQCKYCTCLSAKKNRAKRLNHYKKVQRDYYLNNRKELIKKSKQRKIEYVKLNPNYYKEYYTKHKVHINEYKKSNKGKKVRLLYIKKNKEKILKYSREWAKNNPEKIYEATKKYRLNNKYKVRQWKIDWAKNNPEKIKKMNRKPIKKLYDCYIRNQLCSYKTNLKAKDIPNELVELKRIQLKLTRELRK